MQLHRAMVGVHAAEVMALDCQFVPGGTSVAEFVEQYLLHSGTHCFFVGEPERPRGIITLTDVRALPREEWRSASVQAVMRPLERVWSVTPATEIEEVLRLMDAQNVAQIPVMENGHLLGLIRRDQLLHLILTRAELFNLRDEAKSAKA
jgi:CBS domain-containing protein